MKQPTHLRFSDRLLLAHIAERQPLTQSIDGFAGAMNVSRATILRSLGRLLRFGCIERSEYKRENRRMPFFTYRVAG